MTDGGASADSAGRRAFTGPVAPPPARPPEDPGRMIVTRGGNDRHIRRAALLDRWPVLAEEWARAIERISDE